MRFLALSEVPSLDFAMANPLLAHGCTAGPVRQRCCMGVRERLMYSPHLLKELALAVPHCPLTWPMEVVFQFSL